MNRGIVGFPHRPSDSLTLRSLVATDATVGTPVARTIGRGGQTEGAAPLEIAKIKVPLGLWDIAYSPGDDRLYAVSSGADGLVIIINPATNQIVDRLHVGGACAAVIYVPSIKRVCVLRADGVIAAIDPKTHRITSKGTSGVAGAKDLAWSSRVDRVYVVGGTACAVLNPATWAVTATPVLSAGSVAVTECPVDSLMYIASTSGMTCVNVLTNVAGVPHAAANALDYIEYCPVDDRIYGTSRSINELITAQPFVNLAIESTDVSAGWGPIVSVPSADRVFIGDATAGGVRPVSWRNTHVQTWGAALSCGNPRAIAYCPTNGRCYAVHEAVALMSVVG